MAHCSTQRNAGWRRTLSLFGGAICGARAVRQGYCPPSLSSCVREVKGDKELQSSFAPVGAQLSSNQVSPSSLW